MMRDAIYSDLFARSNQAPSGIRLREILSRLAVRPNGRYAQTMRAHLES